MFSALYDKKYLSSPWFETTEGWSYCFQYFISQKMLGCNRHIPFPVNPTTVVGSIRNISFDISDIDNFWKNGCYYQCWRGHISIGKGTWIAQNVGIITENHNINNLSEHTEPQDVIIGDSCWIGMNSVILPGVHLGNKTIVGAGSIVTKSFPMGNCVICGNPARIIKTL